MKTNNMSTIYGCKINGKEYVAIFETLGWNFYKITGEDTMNTYVMDMLVRGEQVLNTTQHHKRQS